ncbi:MAG: DUF433 domain-containing protein [Acidobacteria bacterium]|nr:DUF433 domain-containing protein [Acidobacteriota bacterium]
MPDRESVVHSDPEILGGTPVFVGTRVPLKNLIDYLAAGDSLDDFLDDFPSVAREQAVAALEVARDALSPDLGPFRGQEVEIRLYQRVLVPKKIAGNAYWRNLRVE